MVFWGSEWKGMIVCAGAMTWFQRMNLYEACLWFGIAAGCVLRMAFRRRFDMRTALFAGGMILFGVSDLLETENWWTPWWLLVLKVGCVLGFISLARSHYRAQAGSGDAQEEAR